MIEFDNRQNIIDFNDEIKNLIEKSINTALEFEKFTKPFEINVILTDNDGIKKINREYRFIDKETDVLSFPMLDFKFFEKKDIDINDINDFNIETGEAVLGDIVLSLQKAQSQAIEYGHSIEREIAFLTVHSVLHLLGYDHEEDSDRIIMREREEKILDKLGLIRGSN
ncbi:probable rRNA maturation factor [Caloramator quimbayensis]|uniref:Endoribonuclease YbeY n=1 Tax=Caloramator quimbayensis TaxID=1147123 RepID=A0A1T4X8Z8_9CLOT|nr:rRNA maturation RNase YbeY [Caloramator quimbayensis]SKA85939.1 probable rRNA maturation factor [Caloramator quimbayensis]